MGNNQSNPQEYTPEQYKQYLAFQEQQRLQQSINNKQPSIPAEYKQNITPSNNRINMNQPNHTNMYNNNKSTK